MCDMMGKNKPFAADVLSDHSNGGMPVVET